jgi:hypothetical protein
MIKRTGQVIMKKVGYISRSNTMKIDGIILLSVGSILFAMNSCNDNGVAPLMQPGRRDYVWSLDTLQTEFNDISGLWGSSPDDVWAGGGGGTFENYLWHYDGKKWIAWFASHPQRVWCTAEAIFGFASNDVWIGGQSFGDPGAGLSHWDGSQWGRYFNYNPEPDSSGLVYVVSIWGNRSENVYAMGTILYKDASYTSRGFILHYNGSTWHEVLRGDRGYQYHFLRMVGAQDRVYILEYRPNDVKPDSNLLVLSELRRDHLAEIYSDIEQNIGFASISAIAGKLYLGTHASETSILSSYTQGTFVEQLSVRGSDFSTQFDGRNEEDIFLFTFSGLAHFDGTDIKFLYTFPSRTSQISCWPALFNKEVFFGIRDESKTYCLILHGKLE